MEPKAFVIFAEDRHPWRLGSCGTAGVSIMCIPAGPDASPKQRAESASQLLRQEGYAGRGVILAVPSEWCLCASIGAAGLSRRNKHQSLVYRLEDKLPIAAEEFVADFLILGDEALGVCTTPSVVAPWLAALEAEGIAVQCIIPTALLALQSQVHNERWTEADVAICGHNQSVEIFALAGNKPWAWYLLPQDSADIAVYLGLHAIKRGSPLRIVTSGLSEAAVGALAQFADAQVRPIEQPPMLEAAAGMSNEVLMGRTCPWIDLRRDALAVQNPIRQIRRPLSCAIAAILLLLLALSGVLLWRTHQYQVLARHHELRQEAIYREVFRGQTVPANVKLRLTSEERKLAGISGEALRLPDQGSALTLMVESLRRLPADLRFQIMELRFDADKLYLEGRARSHGDADAIAAALRKQRGFQVEPPKSEQVSGGAVAFSISGVAGPSSPTTRRASP